MTSRSGFSRNEIARISDDRTIPTKYEGKIESNFYCRAWNPKREKYCGSRAGMGTAHSGVGRCRRHGGQRRGGDGRVKHGGRSALRVDRIKQLIEEHLADPQLLDVSKTLATAKALTEDYIEQYYEITPALLAWYAGTEPITEEQRLALTRSIDELENLYSGEPTASQAADLALARTAITHLAEPRTEKPRQVPEIGEAVRYADIISKIIHRVNLHHSQNAISYARLATFMFTLRQELDALVPDRDQFRKITERVLQIRI